MMTWARWFEAADRQVALDFPDDDVRVSTVFLGLDHQWGNGPPLWFETMIFGGALDGMMQRDLYWKPTLRRCGIRDRRCYATRHTFATVALMRGVPPACIAHQLGHVDSKQVHEKYARCSNEADAGRARGILEQALAVQHEQAEPFECKSPGGSAPASRRQPRQARPALKRVA